MPLAHVVAAAIGMAENGCAHVVLWSIRRAVINVAPNAPFSHKIAERVVMTESGVPIALIYHA
jgi:hypothetical protein